MDHPSAISLLGPDPLDPRARLLVVYDYPSADRRPWADTVLADRVRIGAVDADDTDEDRPRDPADGGSGERRPPRRHAEGDGLAPDDLAFVDTVEPVDVCSPDELDDEPHDEPRRRDRRRLRRPRDAEIATAGRLADEPAPVDPPADTARLPDHVRRRLPSRPPPANIAALGEHGPPGHPRAPSVGDRPEEKPCPAR